jgi:hypothetical protein
MTRRVHKAATPVNTDVLSGGRRRENRPAGDRDRAMACPAGLLFQSADTGSDTHRSTDPHTDANLLGRALAPLQS